MLNRPVSGPPRTPRTPLHLTSRHILHTRAAGVTLRTPRTDTPPHSTPKTPHKVEMHHPIQLLPLERSSSLSHRPSPSCSKCGPCQEAVRLAATCGLLPRSPVTRVRSRVRSLVRSLVRSRVRSHVRPPVRSRCSVGLVLGDDNVDAPRGEHMRHGEEELAK